MVTMLAQDWGRGLTLSEFELGLKWVTGEEWGGDKVERAE
jgi:hypothetical protein